MKSEFARRDKPAEPDKPLGRVTWEPMPGKVVCKVVGERETYGRTGLIVRPPTAAQPRTTAEVVAVYDPFVDYGDTEETKSYVEVGDIVVFGKHSGVEVTYGDQTVIVLREQEILTKVKLESPEDVAAMGVAPGAFDDLEG